MHCYFSCNIISHTLLFILHCKFRTRHLLYSYAYFDYTQTLAVFLAHHYFSYIVNFSCVVIFLLRNYFSPNVASLICYYFSYIIFFFCVIISCQRFQGIFIYLDAYALLFFLHYYFLLRHYFLCVIIFFTFARYYFLVQYYFFSMLLFSHASLFFRASLFLTHHQVYSRI